MPNTEPEADAIIMDESALVNIQPPRTSKNFDDYANEYIIGFQELDHILLSTKEFTLCPMCIRSPA